MPQHMDVIEAATFLQVGKGQLHEAADFAAVKRTYRKQALTTHPDKIPHSTPQTQRDALIEQFKRATAAMEALQAHDAAGGSFPVDVTPKSAEPPAPPEPPPLGRVVVEWSKPRGGRVSFARLNLLEKYSGEGVYPGTLLSPDGRQSVSGQFYVWVESGQTFANGMGVACPVTLGSQSVPIRTVPPGRSQRSSSNAPPRPPRPPVTRTPPRTPVADEVDDVATVLRSFSSQGSPVVRRGTESLTLLAPYTGPGVYPGEITSPGGVKMGQFRVWETAGEKMAEGMGVGPVRVRVTTRMAGPGSRAAPVVTVVAGTPGMRDATPSDAKPKPKPRPRPKPKVNRPPSGPPVNGPFDGFVG